MSSVYSKLKVFKALNCATCKCPFSATPNDPQSARNLDCGLSVCKECFENEEFPPKTANRKHRCTPRTNCFNNPNPAYFFLELLSSKNLSLSPTENGYILADELPPLECTVCQEEFILECQKPVQLYCNHAVCLRCVLRLRTMPNPNTKHPYVIVCPICRAEAAYDDDYESQYTEFLRELPGMREQLEHMRRKGQRLCKDCGKIAAQDDVFNCTDCQLLCCGPCGIRKHKSHELKDFAEDEIIRVKRLAEETEAQIERNFDEFSLKFALLNDEVLANIREAKQNLLNKVKSVQAMGQLLVVTQQLGAASDCQKTFDDTCAQLYAQIELANGKLKAILEEISKS